MKTLYIPIDTTIFDVVECPKLVKRGDTLRLQIKVFTDGVLRNLTGQNIDIILQKADGTFIENTIDIGNISNGVVTATLDIQATVIAGLVSGELQLSDESGQESTNTFTFEVNSSLADGVIEVSKDDINTLNQLRDLIATGETTIAEYETHILAIANSIEAVEALGNIKSYIDVNLAALQQENAEAVVNIANETTQNNQAVQNIADLTSKNATATSNVSELNGENATASSNISSLDTKNATATSNISALDTKNGIAITNIANLDSKNAIAITNINNLDPENDRAETNIIALESFGDATTLLEDTTAVKNEIEGARGGQVSLDARLDGFDSSLSENTQQHNFLDQLKLKFIYGAAGDGVTDDTTAIKNAIADCQTNGYTLIFPSGYTFAISEELEITTRINIYGYGSELKAIASINSILNFNENIYYDGNGTALENRLDLYEIVTVQGLKLNCNNLTTNGLLITKSPKVNYLNLDVVKCQGNSINISQATESTFDKINIYAGYNTNSIGILVKSNDCEFSNIHMIDCHTAIKTNSVNIYNNIHAWIMHTALTYDSVFFEMYEVTILTNRLTQCYSDTYKIVFKANAQKQNIQAIQLFVAYNSTVYPTDNIPYLFYANSATPDYFFSWSGVESSYIQGASTANKILASNFDVCAIKLDSSNFYQNVSGIKKFTNTALTLLTGVTTNQHNHVYRDGGVVNLSLSLTINLATVTISNGIANIGNLPYQILYPIDPQSFSAMLSTTDSTNFPEVASMAVGHLNGFAGNVTYDGLLRIKIPASLLSVGTLYVKCSISYINRQLTNSAITYSDNN